jgi:hypothetical protein
LARSTSSVIVAPSGRILLIEQKSGFLKEGQEGLLKVYGGKDKRVPAQLKRNLDNLTARLAPVAQGQSLIIDYLLYCPDYALKSPGTAGLPPERIVDARSRDALCARIDLAFPQEPDNDLLAHRLRRFFADELQLVSDVSALVGRAREMVTSVSGGLTTWARRLEFAPFRLRVVDTAGSGKTQLALAVLNDAAAEGRRALYVCFNRPLSDRIAQVAPKEAMVANFHQLCDRRLRESEQSVDYKEPGAFDLAATRFAQLPLTAETDRFDELIIDEGQDFEQEWVAPVMAQLRPGGRVWWLEDPMQNLYGRPPVQLPGFTVLRSPTNYRNPRDVVDFLRRIVGASDRPNAASPFTDGVEEFITYEDPRGLIDGTTRAVTRAMAAGFKRDEIAIVTFTGRNRSALLGYDQIGSHTLRRATGRFDLALVPEYTDGDFLIETVYRFKGQSAPCVVLTEVDFESWDDTVERRLFVGATRASMKLYLVLSTAAATQLMQRMGDVQE